jgi:hypothetical protein
MAKCPRRELLYAKMKPSRYQARLKGQVMKNMVGRGAVVLTALLVINCASVAERVPNAPSPSGCRN